MKKVNSISTILLDIGGVYMKGDVTDFINDSYKALGIDKKISAGNRIAINEDLNKGTITAEECFREFFGVPINDKQMDEIIELWTSNWKTTDKMTDLVSLLKKSYTVAALSNSDEANAKRLYKDGTYSHFDYVFLSHEMGLIKPDEEIYLQALDRLGVQAEECLFIDDQEKCLEPAREIGMKTILFKNYRQLKKDLEERGIIQTHKRYLKCDYHGACTNRAYREVHPSLMGGKHKDKGWSYLCRKHFYQEQKRLNNKLPYSSVK